MVTKPEYASKEELKEIARELLEIMRPKKLPIWQVKETFQFAIEMADWEPMK